MRSYRQIGPFENARRIDALNGFRNQAIGYFSSRKSSYNSLKLSDTEASLLYRKQINANIGEIEEIIFAVGIQPLVNWRPPPIVGGRSQNLDLVANIFNLDSYRISPQTLIDFIDRAIGRYERNSTSSVLRMLNPIFYLSLLVYVFSRIPFWFVKEIGFETGNIEFSLIGRVIKFLFSLIPLAASFLAILQHFELLIPFKDSLEKFFRLFA